MAKTTQYLIYVPYAFESLFNEAAYKNNVIITTVDDRPDINSKQYRCDFFDANDAFNFGVDYGKAMMLHTVQNS